MSFTKQKQTFFPHFISVRPLFISTNDWFIEGPLVTTVASAGRFLLFRPPEPCWVLSAPPRFSLEGNECDDRQRHLRGAYLRVVLSQPSHIMLQRGRDHVCALLPHHEVPTGRPPSFQQRPLRPLQSNQTHQLDLSMRLIDEKLQSLRRLHGNGWTLCFHRVTPLPCCTPCGRRLAT